MKSNQYFSLSFSKILTSAATFTKILRTMQRRAVNCYQTRGAAELMGRSQVTLSAFPFLMKPPAPQGADFQDHYGAPIG